MAFMRAGRYLVLVAASVVGAVACSKADEAAPSVAAETASPTAEAAASATAVEAPPIPAEPDPSASSSAAADSGGWHPKFQPRPDSSAAGPPATPPEKPVEKADRDKGIVPEGAVALPVMKSCLRECMERGSLGTDSASKLEAECRKRCLAGCHQKCAAESDARSPSFVEGCRQDCTRQVEEATI